MKGELLWIRFVGIAYHSETPNYKKEITSRLDVLEKHPSGKGKEIYTWTFDVLKKHPDN